MKTDNALQYRPARQDDWPAVRELLTANQLPLDGAESCLMDFILAEMNGEIVGCAGLERFGHVALLRSCAVDSRHRHRGIGKELTTKAIALSRDLGVAQLVLLTTTAEHFFSWFGFVQVDRTDVPEQLKATAEFRTACPATATVMRLTLRPA